MENQEPQQAQIGLTDREFKRKRIFDKYSSNLRMLVESGILDLTLNYDKTYICPLCIQQFSEESLSQTSLNPLTLEDVPPFSLGGKADILTCRNCNGLCGTTIDNHLKLRMDAIEKRHFPIGGRYAGSFSNNSVKNVNGEIVIQDDGTMHMIHDIRHNPPGKVDEFVNSVDSNEANRYVTLKMKGQPINNSKAIIALLKTTYLLMFKEFGYVFLFSESYKRVRNQILNNDITLYPTATWFTTGNSIKLPNEGIYYIVDEGIECLVICFLLKTKFIVVPHKCILPLKHDIQYSLKDLAFKSNVFLPAYIIRQYLGFKQPSAQFQVTGHLLDYDSNSLLDLRKTRRLLRFIETGKYN